MQTATPTGGEDIRVTVHHRTVDAVGDHPILGPEVTPPPYDVGDEVKIWGFGAAPKHAARLRTVVEATFKVRGARTKADPERFVTQYFTVDGELLAEKDKWAEPVIEGLRAQVAATEARVQATERKLQETVAELDATRKQRDEVMRQMRILELRSAGITPPRRRRSR